MCGMSSMSNRLDQVEMCRLSCTGLCCPYLNMPLTILYYYTCNNCSSMCKMLHLFCLIWLHLALLHVVSLHLTLLHLFCWIGWKQMRLTGYVACTLVELVSFICFYLFLSDERRPREVWPRAQECLRFSFPQLGRLLPSAVSWKHSHCNITTYHSISQHHCFLPWTGASFTLRRELKTLQHITTNHNIINDSRNIIRRTWCSYLFDTVVVSGRLIPSRLSTVYFMFYLGFFLVLNIHWIRYLLQLRRACQLYLLIVRNLLSRARVAMYCT